MTKALKCRILKKKIFLNKYVFFNNNLSFHFNCFLFLLPLIVITLFSVVFVDTVLMKLRMHMVRL